MRLTLRTLLAWLDDTLEPNQVREIGMQVAGSAMAQELADRIHRVTRQRRLTVPGGSGADGADPNVVAGYLDNDLAPDEVGEYEKKCLESDVVLAEVASVHQILSMLGQKVPVPPEARLRMYQLVKGRESIRRKRPGKKRSTTPEPVTRPIQPWVTPEAPERPWIERFGPYAACLLLTVLALSMAWWSLSRQPAHSPSAVGDRVAEGAAAPIEPVVKPAVLEGAGAAVASAPAAEDASGERGPETAAALADAARKAFDAPPADASKKDAEKAAGESAAAKTKKPEESAPPIPAGAVGLIEKPEGVFLREDRDKREWVRVLEQAPLRTADHLLCLTPFRATLRVGKMRTVLVGETEVRALSSPGESTPVLELMKGRILVHQVPSCTLKVVFAGRPAKLELAPESNVAIERVERRAYGEPVTTTQPLAVCCIEGEAALSLEGKEVLLKPSNVALIDGTDIQVSTPDALPPWAAQAEPSPYELQVRDQFYKMFHADRPVLTEIVGAIEDERPEVKQLAISALKAMGDLSYLMPVLAREGDPAARRHTIEAIRSYMALGPEAGKRVRASLDEIFGAELGGIAQHMLIGYSPVEAAQPEVYARLVPLLSPEQPSVGIRELALDTLMRLTGRDNLGYNPDEPGGKGLEAWTDLLSHDELRPAPSRSSKAKAKAKAKKKGQ